MSSSIFCIDCQIVMRSSVGETTQTGAKRSVAAVDYDPKNNACMAFCTTNMIEKKLLLIIMDDKIVKLLCLTLPLQYGWQLGSRKCCNRRHELGHMQPWYFACMAAATAPETMQAGPPARQWNCNTDQKHTSAFLCASCSLDGTKIRA